MKKEVELSRGTISVTVKNHHPNWDLDSLLGFAERINPKRAFLFVSKVLGKHIPVQPSVMRKTYQDLSQLITEDLPQPLTVVGMAETAVCLGAGVYREIKKDYGQNAVFVTTTRHPAKNLQILSDFLEEHSHAQDQFIYSSNNPELHDQIMQSKTLVLIDDEISTGKTFKNLIKSLIDSGLDQVERIVLVSLVNWNDGNLEKEFMGRPIDTIALINGNWEWQQNNKELTKAMPNVASTESGEHEIIAPITWGREPGFLDIQAWSEIQPKKLGEKVLVLGSGEFTWIPFLFAEQLEQQGAEVYFSSTTRSPIMEGHAIESICYFTDNYGLGISNFAYNVKHQDFDRVMLIIETKKNSVDPTLFSQIKNLEIISYDN